MKLKTLFLSVVWLLVGEWVTAQPPLYQFMRLDLRNGLSHNQVNAVIKDSRGFMWFGTMSGLNRFDGYDFKIFRNSPDDSTSISDNYISNIFELPDQKLWITTRNGSDIYDPLLEKFVRNEQNYLASLSLPAGVVSSVVKDKSGNFWFVYSNNGGIYKYETATKKVQPFQHSPLNASSISTNDVASLAEDVAGNIWVIHRNGLIDKLDAKNHERVFQSLKLKEFAGNTTQNYAVFTDKDGDLWLSVLLSGTPGGVLYYRPADDKLMHISKNTPGLQLNTQIVTGITQDYDGVIWIGTDHGGVNLIDKKRMSIRYMLNDAEDHTSISQNSIYAVYKDNDEVIWLGTYKQGVNYYNNKRALFGLYRHKVSDPSSLPYEDVNVFTEDAKGNIWIGTNGGGLIYFDRQQNSFKSFRHHPNDPTSISSNVIVSLHIDHLNKLWIGTYFGGLNCYDGKKFTHYRRNPNDSSSISDDSIWEIFEDSDKNLWVGTLSAGLNLYNRANNTFKHFRVEDGGSVHSNYIAAIVEDKDKRLWLGTSNGLDVYNRATGAFVYIARDEAEPKSLSNNNVISLLRDSRGFIWVGTREGLNLLNKDGKTFTIFTKEHGLADNTILNIKEDNLNNLWVSTPNGLSNVDVISDSLGQVKIVATNYDESRGLQGRDFNDKAGYKTRAGELLFGGPYGFNIFNPERFAVNHQVPELVFTEFQLFNRPVNAGEEIGGRTVLRKSIAETDSLTLKHNENIFSITFATPGTMQSPKDQFEYILEGFNKQWLSTDGRQRVITYTNLDPGDYTFRLKPIMAAGVEAPEKILHITIQPPFWKSGTAILLYVLGAIGILFLARHFTIQRANYRFRVAQQEKEAKRIHELDMLKLKFFTNVSHEFRTPLSLIIAPVEKLVKQTEDEPQKKQFQLIYRNARRLLGLVNQLLDFRKLEMKELRLQTSMGDIVGFVKELTASFADLAEKKNIQFCFSSKVDVIQMAFDPDKIERIMFNMLSNAFKFTPEKGRISVDVDLRDADAVQGLEIMVKDSGIGIPNEDQEKIFERFFQHELPENLLNQGSGIGLAISKEFVRLHGGTIDVESAPGAGTSFRIWLPLQQSVNNGHETEMILHASNSDRELETMNGHHKTKGTVLVVDDNDDIRFYIKDNLRNHYTVLEAGDGKEAWNKTLKYQPDLIISDIMMPEMDGVEFCTKIKNTAATSHIPVILLTARTTEEQKLEGYHSGANAYITKPFSFEMLQSRIKSILAHQEVMRRRFHKQVEVEASELDVTPVDEQFIKDAVALVEKNISENDFSVEDLSKALAMSRVALYKKLVALTGKAPLDFIRSIRMKRAAQLMIKSKMTIAEIGYEVGFSTPKYFAKSFKKEFGLSPSEYILSNRIKE